MKYPVYLPIYVNRITNIFLAIGKTCSPQQMPNVFDVPGNQVIDCNYFVAPLRQAVT